MSAWLKNGILPISLLLFIASGWLYWQSQTRERRLVEKYSPKIIAMCEDFDAKPPTNPRTFEDLLDPLVELVTELAR